MKYHIYNLEKDNKNKLWSSPLVSSGFGSQLSYVFIWFACHSFKNFSLQILKLSELRSLQNSNPHPFMQLRVTSIEKGIPLSAKKWSSSDFDFSRWVSEAQDVTFLMWPWPEMMGGSLGPTELSFGDPSTWGWPGLGEVRCLERRRSQTQWGSVMRSWRRDCVMIGRDQTWCTQLCIVG